jgi:glycosyltransferase involved in cell wall biosynthesis
MSTPLVSVVIPTYDRPDRLLDAIETVKSQTYDRIALIVVDDCSPEPVETQVQELELERFECVQCLRQEENRGAAAARCTGIEAAEGEFIAFLDDDDRWNEQKLQAQIDAIHDWGEDAGVAYTGMRVVNEDGETTRVHTPDLSGEITQTLLCRNIVGSYSRVLVRRSAVEEVGYPDQSFPSWQDLEWWIRLSTDYEFVATPEPLTIIYQSNEHDQISDKFEELIEQTYPFFINKYRPLAAEFGPLFERKMLAWAAFRAGGYNALRLGKFSYARKYLFEAVSKYPVEPKFWLYLLVSLGGNQGYKFSKQLKRALTERN